MTLVRATLASLADLLRVRSDQVEDALSCERLVKRTLSRRGLLVGASAAVAAAALPAGIGFAQLPAQQTPQLLFFTRDVAAQVFTSGRMIGLAYSAAEFAADIAHPTRAGLRLAVEQGLFKK